MGRRITWQHVAGLAALVTACGASATATAVPAGPATTTTRLIVFGGVRWGTNTVTPRIYLIRSDGTGMHRITSTPWVEDTDPVWRPDGRKIVFSRRDQRGWRLYVMSPDGRQLHAISPLLGDAGAAAWSPDGRKLAFVWLPLHPPATGSLSQQIAVINADGRGLRVLTRNETFKGGSAHPTWSPDGRTILFAARTSLAEGARDDIWSIRPTGGGVRRLIVNAADPAWSPDGRRIAFTRRGDLYIASSTGRILRRLTHGYYADSTAPAWSPDGAIIAYDTTHYDKRAQAVSECLTLIDSNGSHRHEITARNPDFWATRPDWRPAG